MIVFEYYEARLITAESCGCWVSLYLLLLCFMCMEERSNFSSNGLVQLAEKKAFSATESRKQLDADEKSLCEFQHAGIRLSVGLDRRNPPRHLRKSHSAV